MGASPVLEDATADPSNPLMLAESSAIADYLIHKYGNGRLALPPQHPRYADYLYWFHFANGNLQPTVFRRFMTRQFGIPTDDARFKGADERVRTAVGWVDRRLRENEWLAGDEFTAADVMTVWCFTTMRVFEPLDLEGYEGILKWLERCTKREGYRRAMARGDPELDIGELVSVKGPKVHEALGV
ncbi:glutathione S-transferase, partial [Corynespora cassiicola Philippines]